MLTIAGLLVLIYLARRALVWVGLHVFALAVGFSVGRRLMGRR